MPKVSVLNPWGLAPRQVDLLDELCRFGDINRSAERLKISKHTAYCYINRAKEKMSQSGDGAMVRMLVAFAIWRQTDGKGVPA